MSKSEYTIGILGLGVMGLSLARNMSSKGHTVIGYDPNVSARKQAGKNGIPSTATLRDCIASLERPRRLLIMVPAGEAVDAILKELGPLLHAGDSIVDGGNSYFKDTARRERKLAAKGIHFLGLGVSGGRKGALEGPGMMAGGSKEAYELWKNILASIAARYEGQPCVAYLGPGGAGHYVKMVHNGIEYGLMQNLAEAYAVLKMDSDLGNQEISEVFRDWNQGKLRGYLTGISAEIFKKKSPEGSFWIDDIKDEAAQKGTGTWTVQNSLELGIPIPGIDAAVRQRQISAHKTERLALNARLKTDPPWTNVRLGVHPDTLKDALYASQLLIYVQGFHLLAVAKSAYSFTYSLAQIAKIWRRGCIISSAMVEFFVETLIDEAGHPLLIEPIWDAILKDLGRLRAVSFLTQSHGMSLVGMSANFEYWCSFTNRSMPTNLIQAQRDYFGGHGLQLKSGEKTSLEWEEPTS